MTLYEVQSEMYDYIAEHGMKNHYPPSVQELAVRFRMSSEGVKYHLKVLREKELVEWDERDLHRTLRAIPLDGKPRQQSQGIIGQLKRAGMEVVIAVDEMDAWWVSVIRRDHVLFHQSGFNTAADARQCLSDWWQEPTRLQQDISDINQAILDYVAEFWQVREYGPTVREIANHIGCKSTSVITTHLRQLGKAGRITWSPRKARSVRLTTGDTHKIPEKP